MERDQARRAAGERDGASGRLAGLQRREQDAERPRGVPDLPHQELQAGQHGGPSEGDHLPDLRCVRRAASDQQADHGAGDVPLPVRLHGEGGRNGARHQGARAELLAVLRRSVHADEPHRVREAAGREAESPRHQGVSAEHRMDRRRLRSGQAHGHPRDPRLHRRNPQRIHREGGAPPQRPLQPGGAHPRRGSGRPSAVASQHLGGQGGVRPRRQEARWKVRRALQAVPGARTARLFALWTSHRLSVVAF